MWGTYNPGSSLTSRAEEDKGEREYDSEESKDRNHLARKTLQRIGLASVKRSTAGTTRKPGFIRAS